MPLYCVIARSRASAVFYPGDALEIICSTLEGRKIKVIFRTNYLPGYDVPVPTNFFIEAIGEATSINEASQSFHQTALEVVDMMAFVVNASLGRLEVELAFDISPDITEHEFVQTFVPNMPILHVPSRPIKSEVVRDFLNVVDKHEHRKRIQSAIAQYCEALHRWNSGHGLICLAHLYMGVEALTKAVLRKEMKSSGKTENDLVELWNIEKKELDNEVRRRFIFEGDVECFQSAKTVSDQFEHGYGDFAKMQKPAAENVVKVARYLRKAIIYLPDTPSSLADVLMSEPYAEPRGPINLIKKVHGTLVGPVEKLPRPGQPYPILNWRSGLKRVIFGKDGRYSFDPDENFTPELGEGAQLRLGRFEVWDNQLVDPKTAAEANKKVPATPITATIVPADKKGFWSKLLLRVRAVLRSK